MNLLDELQEAAEETGPDGKPTIAAVESMIELAQRLRTGDGIAANWGLAVVFAEQAAAYTADGYLEISRLIGMGCIDADATNEAKRELAQYLLVVCDPIRLEQMGKPKIAYNVAYTCDVLSSGDSPNGFEQAESDYYAKAARRYYRLALDMTTAPGDRLDTLFTDLAYKRLQSIEQHLDEPARPSTSGRPGFAPCGLH